MDFFEFERQLSGNLSLYRLTWLHELLQDLGTFIRWSAAFILQGLLEVYL